MPNLDQILNQIISDAVTQAVNATNQDFANRLASLVNAPRAIASPPARQEPLRLQSPPAATKAPKKARNYPAHCIHEDCRKKHKGPRFSFLCEDHMGISKAAKQKLMAAWKAG